MRSPGIRRSSMSKSAMASTSRPKPAADQRAVAAGLDVVGLQAQGFVQVRQRARRVGEPQARVMPSSACTSGSRGSTRRAVSSTAQASSGLPRRRSASARRTKARVSLGTWPMRSAVLTRALASCLQGLARQRHAHAGLRAVDPAAQGAGEVGDRPDMVAGGPPGLGARHEGGPVGRPVVLVAARLRRAPLVAACDFAGQLEVEEASGGRARAPGPPRSRPSRRRSPPGRAARGRAGTRSRRGRPACAAPRCSPRPRLGGRRPGSGPSRGGGGGPCRSGRRAIA